MKKIIVVILVFFFVHQSHAQWNIVANNIFNAAKVYPYGGVITFKDGIVWAGINQLFNSMDSGITWNTLTSPVPGAQISEITFLDKDTGAILFIDKGGYLTYDGGKTWTHILTASECFGLSFVRNGKELFLAERSGLHGTVHYTSDGGLTWSQQVIEGSGGGCYDAAYSPKAKKAYVLSRYINPTRSSHINVSYDFGKTWTRESDIDLDCYSFALDTCDPNKIYLGNEEFDDATNGLSEIFLSTDDGGTWTSEAQGTIGYFASCFSITPNVAYTASSLGDGIFRSLDHGKTWKSIGGPNPREDTRLLCAINNNIILAADQQGNIWRTTNSGGDSITTSSLGGSTVSFSISSRRIITDSLNITVRLPIYLHTSMVMPAFDMVIHYPVGSLTYQKSLSFAGNAIDVPGGAWAGRAAVHFSAADLSARKDSLIGWSLFNWMPYEFDCAHITFDSMSINMTANPCAAKGNVSDSSTEGIVGSYPSCGLAKETDVDPPRFTLFQNKNSTIDSIQFDDARATDEGLRSIWWIAESGTDTNKIKVLGIFPPILACYNDKQSHTVKLVQLDTNVGGCYDFTFTDCLGHQSYTKLCIASRTQALTPALSQMPMELEVHPNPFSHRTTFTYTVADYGAVKLYLFDELGRKVAKIIDGVVNAGTYSIDFDASKLASGNYIARMETDSNVISRRVIIEK